MKLHTLPAPILITDQPALKSLVFELLKQPVVAVDTESNSMYAYQEQVCLLQFSTTEKDYLVDPLSLVDLSSLAPLFNSPVVQKIFHAAEYDVICLHRDFGFQFANLFDTMAAARILSWKRFGLGSILEDLYGVKMDKKYQRADWGKRPLSAELMSYARLDTRYLIQLAEHQTRELREKGRWELAEEDFIRACQPLVPETQEGKLLCERITGVYDLSPREVTILESLSVYRDQMARQQNRPWFKVIGDNTLVAIASAAPQNQQALARLPGMTKGQMQRYGSGLLNAVQRGLATPSIRLRRSPRPDNGYLLRLDGLRNWRKAAAQELAVESGVVLPRDLLYLLAREAPQNYDSLSRLMADVPWRLRVYGEQIADVLDRAV